MAKTAKTTRKTDFAPSGWITKKEIAQRFSVTTNNLNQVIREAAKKGIKAKPGDIKPDSERHNVNRYNPEYVARLSEFRNGMRKMKDSKMSAKPQKSEAMTLEIRITDPSEREYLMNKHGSKSDIEAWVGELIGSHCKSYLTRLKELEAEFERKKADLANKV